jgi:hypothetical protein
MLMVVFVYSMAQLRSGEPPNQGKRVFIVHSTVSYANLVPSKPIERVQKRVPKDLQRARGLLLQQSSYLKAEVAADVLLLVMSHFPKISPHLSSGH